MYKIFNKFLFERIKTSQYQSKNMYKRDPIPYNTTIDMPYRTYLCGKKKNITIGRNIKKINLIVNFLQIDQK